MYQALSSKEIMEWMAYDKTIDSDWVKEYKEQLEIEKSEQDEADVRAAQIKKLLGGG